MFLSRRGATFACHPSLLDRIDDVLLGSLVAAVDLPLIWITYGLLVAALITAPPPRCPESA